jgi:hypothetical protein
MGSNTLLKLSPSTTKTMNDKEGGNIYSRARACGGCHLVDLQQLAPGGGNTILKLQRRRGSFSSPYLNDGRLIRFAF